MPAANPMPAASPPPTDPPATAGLPVESPVVPPVTGAEPGPAASAAPSPPVAEIPAQASPGTDEEPVMAPDPPEVDLVKEEVPGSLVTLAPASASGRRPAVAVALPARPGLYRLVVTFHDAAGVAYDSATQGLFPSLVVAVTGPLWATYGTPDQVLVGAGRRLDVRVTVANSGSQPWGKRPIESLVDPAPIADADPPLLVARWVGLDGTATAASAAGTVPAYVDPGASATLELILDAPATGGRYLLLFDVLLPDGSSLAAAGVPPGLMRVTVEADGAAAGSDTAATPPPGSQPATDTPSSTPFAVPTTAPPTAAP